MAEFARDGPAGAAETAPLMVSQLADIDERTPSEYVGPGTFPGVRAVWAAAGRGRDPPTHLRIRWPCSKIGMSRWVPEQ